MTWFRGRAAPETPNLRSKNQRQERLRRPPGAFATWQAAGGRAPPATSPEALGSFLGVKAKPLRGRCASLDPIPPTVPSKPLRASGAFFSEGRVKGLVRPAAP